MTSNYVLSGFGGPWECRAERPHVGATSTATGVPLRCPFLGCDAEVVRTGDGSREANRRLAALRERRSRPARGRK